MSTHTRWRRRRRRKCRRGCIACISAVHPFEAKSCATLLHFAFCVWLYFLLFPTIFILSKSFHDCMSAPRSPLLTPPHCQRILRIVDILHCILTLSVVCRASCLHKTKTNTNPDVVQWDNLCNKILQFVPTYHRRIQPLHCHWLDDFSCHDISQERRWRKNSFDASLQSLERSTLLHNINHQEVWSVCVTFVCVENCLNYNGNSLASLFMANAIQNFEFAVNYVAVAGQEYFGIECQYTIANELARGMRIYIFAIANVLDGPMNSFAICAWETVQQMVRILSKGGLKSFSLSLGAPAHEKCHIYYNEIYSTIYHENKRPNVGIRTHFWLKSPLFCSIASSLCAGV